MSRTIAIGPEFMKPDARASYPETSPPVRRRDRASPWRAVAVMADECALAVRVIACFDFRMYPAPILRKPGACFNGSDGIDRCYDIPQIGRLAHLSELRIAQTQQQAL